MRQGHEWKIRMVLHGVSSSFACSDLKYISRDRSSRIDVFFVLIKYIVLDQGNLGKPQLALESGLDQAGCLSV
jgi:hypothetical protein